MSLPHLELGWGGRQLLWALRYRLGTPKIPAGKINGAVYTTPISITGTKGQSATVIIKAIAVKDGMQDSAVQTFTYTINLPADSEPGTVPPTPQPEDDKDEVPKTGDASSPVIPFMLMSIM